MKAEQSTWLSRQWKPSHLRQTTSTRKGRLVPVLIVHGPVGSHRRWRNQRSVGELEMRKGAGWMLGRHLHAQHTQLAADLRHLLVRAADPLVVRCHLLLETVQDPRQ